MKVYKTNGDSKFDVEIRESEENEKVKVRITHVLPCASDVKIFSGDSSTKYPFVIGHSAIGVVSNDREEYGLKRGMKVIVNPYSTQGIERFNWEEQVKTQGVDEDGFLREFVFLDKEKIIPFPEDVTEGEAIFTERIALALKALNAFSVNKGDYIVIVGGNTTCNILAQLAIYFQMIPILIDSNARNLAMAEKCGVPYIINETKESAMERVAEYTGGRMAESAVVYMDEELAPSYVFPLTKFGGKCVILGENKVIRNFDADISEICRRQLRVKGVNNGESEFDSAVNILAQKILNFDGFIDKTVEMKDADVALREMRDDVERYFNIVLKL